ncbi:MAG: hypothetical protein ACREIQ_03645 [Nitrospiria bacterium]
MAELTPSQRAANEKKAKEASERVKQSEAERENINPGGLGAAAKKAAEKRANPDKTMPYRGEDSPLVAAAKKKKVEKEAQSKAIKE